MALANDMWLKALGLELIRAANSNTGSALPIARQFLAEADSLPQEAAKLPPFSKALVQQLPVLGESKPGALSRLLKPLLLNPSLKGEEKLPRPPQSTKYCQAIIEEPVSDSDTVFKFTGGLILGTNSYIFKNYLLSFINFNRKIIFFQGIPLTAKILNLRDPSTVRIKLRHPDQKVQLLLPRKSDLKLQNNEKTNDYRLRTTVLLSHQVWMEACSVDISIALLVPSATTSTQTPLDESCVIDLCKPTKISISPKQVKRGI